MMAFPAFVPLGRLVIPWKCLADLDQEPQVGLATVMGQIMAS